MRRTQIYLSDQETEALDGAARRTGHTRSQLIREAIEGAYVRRKPPQDVEQAILASAGAWRRGENGMEYVERLRKGRLALLHSSPASKR